MLPPETVDEIAGLISHPRDLLPLALTCKSLKELIIRRHLEYRVIRAPLWSAVWEHLALRPDLARNVRSVQITALAARSGFSAKRFVPNLPSDSTLPLTMKWGTILSSLLATLSIMDLLETFHWSPGITLEKESDWSVEADIFRQLRNTTSLRRLAIEHESQSRIPYPSGTHPVSCHISRQG
jgi:hypothetical protein